LQCGQGWEIGGTIAVSKQERLLRTCHKVVKGGSKQNGAVSIGFKVDSHVQLVVRGRVQMFDARFGKEDSLVIVAILL